MKSLPAGDLSVLCVSKFEPCVRDLLFSHAAVAKSVGIEMVVIADTDTIEYTLPCKIVPLRSDGFIESVLDEAVSRTSGRYILRLDDDESISADMLVWLLQRKYAEADHWKFARAHLWGDGSKYIANLPLWPDHQTRLSTRAMSLGRNSIHCGSPFGGGDLAPVVINHHKFLAKSYEQRAEIVSRYDHIQQGAGSNFKVFSLPEDVIGTENFILEPIENAYRRAASA